MDCLCAGRRFFQARAWEVLEVRWTGEGVLTPGQGRSVFAVTADRDLAVVDMATGTVSGSGEVGYVGMGLLQLDGPGVELGRIVKRFDAAVAVRYNVIGG